MSGDIILISRKPFQNLDAMRDVVAIADGFNPATATNEEKEWGFVTLSVVGRFETFKNRSRLTIKQARALWRSKWFQTENIGDNPAEWLRLVVKMARTHNLI